MRVIVAIILAVTMAACSPAYADRVSVLLGSKHFGAAGQFEEINPGLFYTFDERKIDVSVGVFRNSYKKPSVAVTFALPIVEWEQGELSAFVGVAYYPEDGRRQKVHAGDFIPIGGLQVRHGHLFAQITPMDGKPVDALVSFGITFKLE